MKVIFQKAFFLILITSLVGACHDAKTIGVPVDLIFNSQHCGLFDAGIYRINNSGKLDEIFKKVNAGRLGGAVQKSPEIDFARQQAFLITLGVKPTSGYSLILEKGSAVYRDGILELPVTVIEPGENTIQAPVITTPCVLVTVNRDNFKKTTINKIQLLEKK